MVFLNYLKPRDQLEVNEKNWGRVKKDEVCTYATKKREATMFVF